MNLELRTEILKDSLEIEAKLSKLLMILLDIKENDNKSLGHKGSALSLKSKVDLLYDINKINKDLYNKLIMFMEIRNQFIHNIDSDSFKIVLKRIGKEKKLISLLDEFVANRNYSISNEISEEEKFKLGFNMLSIEIVEELESARKKILEDKLEIVNTKVKAQEAEINDRALKAISDSIDEATDLFNKRWREVFNDEKDIGQSLRTLIQGLFKKKIEEAIKNES